MGNGLGNTRSENSRKRNGRATCESRANKRKSRTAASTRKPALILGASSVAATVRESGDRLWFPRGSVSVRSHERDRGRWISPFAHKEYTYVIPVLRRSRRVQSSRRGAHQTWHHSALCRSTARYRRCSRRSRCPRSVSDRIGQDPRF